MIGFGVKKALNKTIQNWAIFEISLDTKQTNRTIGLKYENINKHSKC
jgi:hypothetical protein